VKTALSLSLIFVSVTLACGARAQQAKPATAPPAPTAPSPTQKNIEAYLRHLYAFGPDVLLVVGTPRESPVEGLLETTIDLTIGENKQTVKFLHKQGRQVSFPRRFVGHDEGSPRREPGTDSDERCSFTGRRQGRSHASRILRL